MRPRGKTVPGNASSPSGEAKRFRRTVTVGSAKHHEHFRDLEIGLHQGTLEALERLGDGETLIGLGLEPWATAPKGAEGPCRITLTVLDLPHKNEESLWRSIRAITPLICAVAAASPCESGSCNGMASNALLQHIRSCKWNGRPSLSLERKFNYGRVEESKEVSQPRTPLSLDSSNGVLQVSLWDVQECARSNLAMVALFSSLLRAGGLGEGASSEECENLLELAARGGTTSMGDELKEMLELAMDNASAEERMYLPIIRDRMESGSLGESLPPLIKELGRDAVVEMLSKCLRTNRPFLAPGPE